MSLPPPSAPSVLMKTKTAYSFWFIVFNDFPKVHRPTLGRKIENYFLDLLESVFISLYLPPEKKIIELLTAIAKLDNLKFILQIAWENKCISSERYSKLSEQLQEIGKIIGGWRKGLEKKTPTQR